MEVSVLNGDLTFDNVGRAGDTTITILPDGTPVPGGFQVLGQNYDISTTAEFSGSVKVCFTYDGTGLTEEEEQALQILHYNGDNWENITRSVDTVNDIICGIADSFSEFTIVVPITPNYDVDEDEYGIDQDCNDNDPGIYPGAEEICDGLDNDCDGEIDEILPNNVHDGDVNGNSSITPQDALMVFQHYLGIITLDECQQDRADVNNSGSITPADALCIFQKYLGLSSCLDVRPE